MSMLETLQNRKAVICGATPVVPVVLENGHTICLEARIMPERPERKSLLILSSFVSDCTNDVGMSVRENSRDRSGG